MSTAEDPSPVVLAFLERLLTDRQRGAVQELSAYQELYPGHATIVAEHYARLMKSPGEAAPPPSEGALEAPATELPRIGRYRVLRELGRGGQGIVYLAEDVRLGRRVALKVLTGLGAASDETLQRFRREAETASKLDHPGICAVFDSGSHDGVPFIAMRYVEGDTLAERIGRARHIGERTLVLDSEEASSGVTEAARETARPPSGTTSRAEMLRVVGLFERVARALHFAHEAGVIHRDVKPGNIMVTRDGEPVICDFGLARDLERTQHALTRSGDLFGTPAYMSPEQLRTQEVPTDRRTDVFSLGVSLYEALTLERPFDAPTREGLYQQILTVEAPDPRRRNPAVADDLRVILETALEKEPDARYQSALDLAEDLRRLRKREPILARPIGRWTRLVRWTQRNPALAASLGATLVILVVATVVAISLAWRAAESLEEWERLADGRRLDDLVAEARGDLWPSVPAKIAAYDTWLGRAGTLIARLPEHRAALAARRSEALPYTEEMARSDRESYVDATPRLEEIERLLGGLERRQRALEEERQSIEQDLERLEELDSRDMAARMSLRRREERLDQVETSLEEIRKTRETVPDLERERAELRRRISVRRTWRFATAADQLRHDKLVELVEGLESLQGDPAPQEATLAGMTARRAFAEGLRGRLGGEDRAAWERCIAEVTRDPRFTSAQLQPIPGLSPLGRDRDSGLWEFWHVASGDRPRWEGEPAGPGRVALDPASVGEGLVMVLVPGGAFVMGARHPDPAHPDGSPHVDALALAEEMPAHDVTLDPYLISKFEVTQAQWMRLHGTNPSYLRAGGASPVGVGIDARHPVTRVTWSDAREACRRWDLVLPTEARWECACRSGTTSRYHTGQEIASLRGHANVGDASRVASYAIELQGDIDDGFVESAPVGSLKPSPWSLHDFHGNVAEWCLDAFHRYQDRDAAARQGLRGSLQGVVPRASRPGSFIAPAFYSRSSARNSVAQDYRGIATGFRPARSLRPR